MENTPESGRTANLLAGVRWSLLEAAFTRGISVMARWRGQVFSGGHVVNAPVTHMMEVGRMA
jgi:hypothetical protein